MMRLRTESHVVIDDDIVRREDCPRCSSWTAPRDQHRQRLLEDAERAHNQAQALVHNAQCEAERLRSAARARFQRVARLGYAAGRRGALRDWNMRSVRAMHDERQQWLRNRERLLQVVVDACAAMLGEDRGALYRRAAHAWSRLAPRRNSCMCRLRPANSRRRSRHSPGSPRSPAGLRVEVAECTTLAQGECRCEWDSGVFETGLQLQLDSLRDVLHKVLGNDAAVECAAAEEADAEAVTC
ncbi:HrpE/YscL family type III secretion apparatus protein [Xanthomonas translucens]|uniref:HrpE/YscL family type III secretion apparatus protein n=1 Tax=Xanthomonas campestris pv. translucens TaxID=343 RepID=UPI001F467D76|nr:HrpE/YscL family type III secretion apparatus protein [Xanthomonas translucens]UII63209.1 HrpE/YscL family type III secretion apparatus protein [Xanthomonas translucens]